jgi:bidirectional [NiFe] hydrogenase diaphorase subunit
MRKEKIKSRNLFWANVIVLYHPFVPVLSEIMPITSRKPALPSDDKRWRIVNGTMRRHGFARDALIETLHTVQEYFGYLDKQSLKFVAASLRVPLSQAYGVATFYHYFTLKPPGRHTCLLCLGTACYIKGAGQLLATAEQSLGIKGGETTPDGNVSLVSARCIGSCSMAPASIFDGEVAGNMNQTVLRNRLEGWKS